MSECSKFGSSSTHWNFMIRVMGVKEYLCQNAKTRKFKSFSFSHLHPVDLIKVHKFISKAFAAHLAVVYWHQKAPLELAISRHIYLGLYIECTSEMELTLHEGRPCNVVQKCDYCGQNIYEYCLHLNNAVFIALKENDERTFSEQRSLAIRYPVLGLGWQKYHGRRID